MYGLSQSVSSQQTEYSVVQANADDQQDIIDGIIYSQDAGLFDNLQFGETQKVDILKYDQKYTFLNFSLVDLFHNGNREEAEMIIQTLDENWPIYQGYVRVVNTSFKSNHENILNQMDDATRKQLKSVQIINEDHRLQIIGYLVPKFDLNNPWEWMLHQNEFN